jgi:hypothetical protein
MRLYDIKFPIKKEAPFTLHFDLFLCFLDKKPVSTQEELTPEAAKLNELACVFTFSSERRLAFFCSNNPIIGG